MAEIPELPVDADGWPAYLTLSYEKSSDATEKAQWMSGFFVVACIVRVFALFCLGNALVFGAWREVTLLLLLHLPTVVRIVNESRRKPPQRPWVVIEQKQERDRPYQILTQSVGQFGLPATDTVVGFPIRIKEGGIQFFMIGKNGVWEPVRFQGWEDIYSFEYCGELGRHYRVRLRAKSFPKIPARSMGDDIRLNIRRLQACLLLFTACWLAKHLNSTGTAYAIAATLLLILAEAILFITAIILLLRERNGQAKTEQTHDLMIDNSVLTASEFLKFLEQRIKDERTTSEAASAGKER